jgi:hypothetical protein
MAKRNPVTTVQGLVTAMQAAIEGDIQPPKHVSLRPGDRPFWEAVVRARAKSEWTEADLVAAANLTRCLADIERVQAEIDAEGDVQINARGTPVMNPKHTLLEILSRRAMALFRLLQMQSVTAGQLKNKVVARAAERDARSAAETLRDELIPLNG